MSLQTLFLIFEIVLSMLYPFYFHMNFKISLSVSAEVSAGI